MAGGRVVLLRHFDIPPQAGLGNDHYDWMIEASVSAPALVTFRVHNRIDPPYLDASTFVCERLPDHRREYLGYEGPISGGRGQVERVAGGQCVSFEELGDSLTVVVRFDGGSAVRYDGRREGSKYVFSARPADQS